MRATAAAVLLLPLLVGLPFGPAAFALAAILVGVVVLIDLSGLLTAAAARPVVLAALLPVIAIPLAALNEGGWSAVPAGLFAAFVLTVVCVLVLGRRAQVTEVIGGTVLAALLPTLGAGALVLLRGLPEGLAWVLGVLLLCAAADAGGPLSRVLQRGLQRRRQADRDVPEPSEAAMLPLLGSGLAVVAVAAVLVVVAPESIPGSAVAGVALAAFAGSRAGSGALRRLAADAGVDLDFGGARFGDGVAVLASSTVLLAAPAAYILASALR